MLKYELIKLTKACAECFFENVQIVIPFCHTLTLIIMWQMINNFEFGRITHVDMCL